MPQILQRKQGTDHVLAFNKMLALKRGLSPIYINGDYAG